MTFEELNKIGLIYDPVYANSEDRIKPGTVVGRLTVDKYLGYVFWLGKRRHHYQTTCICGTVKAINEDELKRVIKGKRDNISCGCYNKEFIKAHRRDMSVNPWYKNKYHGERYKKVTKHYWLMKRRCYDTKSIEYANYGGRGIKICEEWINSENGLDNFCDWMYNVAGFKDDMGRDASLNRVNNDKNYSPDNCYISYPIEQMNNMTTNRIIDWYGQNFTISELCKYKNVKNTNRVSRIYLKTKSIHEALYSPIFTSRFDRQNYIDSSPNGLIVTPKAFTFKPFQFVDHANIDYRDPRREYPHPNHAQALEVMDFQNRQSLKEQGTPVQPFRFTNSGSTDFLLYGKYQY